MNRQPGSARVTCGAGPPRPHLIFQNFQDFLDFSKFRPKNLTFEKLRAHSILLALYKASIHNLNYNCN